MITGTSGLSSNRTGMRVVGAHGSVQPFRPGCYPFVRTRRGCHVIVAAVKAKSKDEPHIQLATAKLPRAVDSAAFANSMYNFASTMTSNGANLPFILPLKTDKLDTGFQIQLLRILEGRAVSIGDLVATVEPEPGVGEVFFVRFYEGEAILGENLPLEPTGRLKRALEYLPDVPVIMNTLRPAIISAVKSAMPPPPSPPPLRPPLPSSIPRKRAVTLPPICTCPHGRYASRARARARA